MKKLENNQNPFKTKVLAEFDNKEYYFLTLQFGGVVLRDLQDNEISCDEDVVLFSTPEEIEEVKTPTNKIKNFLNNWQPGMRSI